MCHINVARLTNEVVAVSQIYASRYGIERDATWFMLKLQDEVGEPTQAFLMLTGVIWVAVVSSIRCMPVASRSARVRWARLVQCPTSPR